MRIGLCVALLAFLLTAIARQRSDRPGPFWPVLVASQAFAWVIPPEWTYARGFGVVFGVLFAMKAWDLRTRRATDLDLVRRPLGYLVWLLSPVELRRPRSSFESARQRFDARLRLGKAGAEGLAIWALLRIEAAWPSMHDDPFVSAQWAMWLLYLSVACLGDLLVVLPMSLGLRTAPLFDRPLLARSPREFWTRRWNLVVHRFALRHTFVGWGGLRHPLRTTCAIFVASGLFHEYLVWACLGHAPRHLGWMLAFFLLHGTAVAMEMTALPIRIRLPRPVTIGLHWLWLSTTAPLFIAPLGEIFADPATPEIRVACPSSRGQPDVASIQTVNPAVVFADQQRPVALEAERLDLASFIRCTAVRDEQDPA